MLTAMVLAVLACTLNIGGPAYPADRRIPVSAEAVASLEQMIADAVVAGATTGLVTFIMSEEQLTSFLHFTLQEDPDPFITDPQVFLRDGQIQIFGTATSGFFIATVRIILTAAADENGQLNIELHEANFGPLPAPEGLKDAITAIISEAYTGSLGPVATGFRIEGIFIESGFMTIVGRLK
jgi:hypothetical protein